MKTEHVKAISALYYKSELFCKVQARYDYIETENSFYNVIAGRFVDGMEISVESNKRAMTEAYCEMQKHIVVNKIVLKLVSLYKVRVESVNLMLLLKW